MATATAPRPTNRRRAAAEQDRPLPEVLGSTLLSDGAPAWIVQSASDPSRIWLVTEVGPDGRLACRCPAAEHGRRCHHVSAVAHEILADEYRRLQAKMAAGQARLDIARETLARIKADQDAAERREHSACRPMTDDKPRAFDVFKH